jgi:purine nucleoside phosphorylase
MRDAARFVQSKTSLRPVIGIVLGSGLGGFADSLIHSVRIPYRDGSGGDFSKPARDEVLGIRAWRMLPPD